MFPCPPSAWDEPEGGQIWIDAYRRGYEEARALVPKQMRLEYSVEQGWGPLCKFLGVEEPVGREFPKGNNRAHYEAKRVVMRELTMARIARKWAPLLMVCSALFVG